MFQDGAQLMKKSTAAFTTVAAASVAGERESSGRNPCWLGLDNGEHILETPTFSDDAKPWRYILGGFCWENYGGVETRSWSLICFHCESNACSVCAFVARVIGFWGQYNPVVGRIRFKGSADAVDTVNTLARPVRR